MCMCPEVIKDNPKVIVLALCNNITPALVNLTFVILMIQYLLEHSSGHNTKVKLLIHIFN